MKIAAYVGPGDVAAWGTVEGAALIPPDAPTRTAYPTLDALIADGDMRALPDLLDRKAALPLAGVTLLPPIGPGAKCICIGVNYRLHVAETGREVPENPSVFLKLNDAVVGHGHPLSHPGISDHYDYEGELAVIIGKGGRHIPEADAMKHVYGYSCFNDGSVRDYQKHSVTAGKNFPRSGALGPWIVTADEIPDPSALILTTQVNGQEVQRSGVDMLIYDIPRLIAYVSAFTVLRPGDVIATGTPSGVGARRQPPLWLKPGDQVEVEISGIGRLSNTVGDRQDDGRAE